MRIRSSPARFQRIRAQHDTRLSMHCDIYRDMGTTEPAPGYAPEYAFEVLHADEPCYIWNLLYLLQGEFVFPERTYPTGQLRGMFKFGLDVRESDEIRNIRTNDDVLFEGPLNIFLVVPHSLLTLTVLRGAH